MSAANAKARAGRGALGTDVVIDRLARAQQQATPKQDRSTNQSFRTLTNTHATVGVNEYYIGLVRRRRHQTAFCKSRPKRLENV